MAAFCTAVAASGAAVAPLVYALAAVSIAEATLRAAVPASDLSTAVALLCLLQSLLWLF